MQIQDAGCHLVWDDQAGSAVGVRVQDVNRVRSWLETRLLLDDDLRDTFIRGMEEALGDEQMLRLSLTQLQTASQVRSSKTPVRVNGSRLELPNHLFMHLCRMASQQATALSVVCHGSFFCSMHARHQVPNASSD